MPAAININTDTWNRILQLLIDDHWEVAYKYDEFDAGIDFDLVLLEKDGEQILFGWDNWVEGEIKCSAARIKAISELANVSLSVGEPVNLKPSLISIYLKDYRE